MSQYTSGETVHDGLVVCDLRSDTVTAPDGPMRDAMAQADVGDDVYGEDPATNRLEATLAERLGKEAGLFLTSGTQSNLVAMLSHCARGEEILTGREYHIYRYEAAGASVLGGIALDPMDVAPDGGLEPEAIRAAVKDHKDSHHAITRLVGMENTHNGRAVSLARCKDAVRAAREAHLSTHLDGARFYNAVEALGVVESDLSDLFDTVSICLSKGLGAPVGSVLVGPKELIGRARRWRKMLGGGTRQSGILAAAGLHALAHNVSRLREDRQRAERLAQALSPYGSVEQATNMVFFSPQGGVTHALRTHLAGRGVRIGGGDERLRLVLHKDVTDEALSAAISAFEAGLS